jgi:hypothetical protein
MSMRDSMRLTKDELCVDRGKDDGGCYQVWLAGKKMSLGTKNPACRWIAEADFSELIPKLHNT